MSFSRDSCWKPLSKTRASAEPATANWLCLGKTQGRGKLDRLHSNNAPPKSNWVYPLVRNFRPHLRS